MSSQAFEDYENELGGKLLAVSKKLSTANTLTGEKRKALVQVIDGDLEDARDLV